MPLQARCVEREVSTQLDAGSDASSRKRAARNGGRGTGERAADLSCQRQRTAARIDHRRAVHRQRAVAKADAIGAGRIEGRAIECQRRFV
ncbi:hypothetical protein G6F57_022818 [Rhizopus arrhizus]|nr:hypothetical protein G6F22_019169 [Rhizopus arrhizus]KAG1375437.1 hypothetical protein G6F60_015440 [Rhizopus arrhizus]KAG1432571.1 hypothetical protein G6F57_022818 [Rhizopus arrhizus]